MEGFSRCFVKCGADVVHRGGVVLLLLLSLVDCRLVKRMEKPGGATRRPQSPMIRS